MNSYTYYHEGQREGEAGWWCAGSEKGGGNISSTGGRRIRGNHSSIWIKSELIKIRRKERSRMDKTRMDWRYNKAQLVQKHQPFISCLEWKQTCFPVEGLITRSCFRKVHAGWQAHHHGKHHPKAAQQLDGTAGCAITLHLRSQQCLTQRLSA